MKRTLKQIICNHEWYINIIFRPGEQGRKVFMCYKCYLTRNFNYIEKIKWR